VATLREREAPAAGRPSTEFWKRRISPPGDHPDAWRPQPLLHIFNNALQPYGYFRDELYYLLLKHLAFAMSLSAAAAVHYASTFAQRLDQRAGSFPRWLQARALAVWRASWVGAGKR
jgi:hypothetical protein